MRPSEPSAHTVDTTVKWSNLGSIARARLTAALTIRYLTSTQLKLRQFVKFTVCSLQICIHSVSNWSRNGLLSNPDHRKVVE